MFDYVRPIIGQKVLEKDMPTVRWRFRKKHPPQKIRNVQLRPLGRNVLSIKKAYGDLEKDTP